MEAWDRGPCWQENLAAGRQHLIPEQTGLLLAGVSTACKHENKSIVGYGFEDEATPV